MPAAAEPQPEPEKLPSSPRSLFSGSRRRSSKPALPEAATQQGRKSPRRSRDASPAPVRAKVRLAASPQPQASGMEQRHAVAAELAEAKRRREKEREERVASALAAKEERAAARKRKQLEAQAAATPPRVAGAVPARHRSPAPASRRASPKQQVAFGRVRSARGLWYPPCHADAGPLSLPPTSWCTGRSTLCRSRPRYNALGSHTCPSLTPARYRQAAGWPDPRPNSSERRSTPNRAPRSQSQTRSSSARRRAASPKLSAEVEGRLHSVPRHRQKSPNPRMTAWAAGKEDARGNPRRPEAVEPHRPFGASPKPTGRLPEQQTRPRSSSSPKRSPRAASSPKTPQERERARLRALKKEMGQDELAQQLLRVWGAEVELAISLKVAGAAAPGLVML